jgi:amino acid transporter
LTAVGLVLAALAATAAYAGVPAIPICLVPMLVIANAYRRLNLWSANCGASFEWVGRAIDPYLGFFTGWLMLAANILGTMLAVRVFLRPQFFSIQRESASNAPQERPPQESASEQNS